MSGALGRGPNSPIPAMLMTPSPLPVTKSYSGPWMSVGDVTLSFVALEETRNVFSRFGEKMWVSDTVRYWFLLYRSVMNPGKPRGLTCVVSSTVNLANAVSTAEIVQSTRPCPKCSSVG